MSWQVACFLQTEIESHISRRHDTRTVLFQSGGPQSPLVVKVRMWWSMTHCRPPLLQVNHDEYLNTRWHALPTSLSPWTPIHLRTHHTILDMVAMPHSFHAAAPSISKVSSISSSASAAMSSSASHAKTASIHILHTLSIPRPFQPHPTTHPW